MGNTCCATDWCDKNQEIVVVVEAYKTPVKMKEHDIILSQETNTPSPEKESSVKLGQNTASSLETRLSRSEITPMPNDNESA